MRKLSIVQRLRSKLNAHYTAQTAKRQSRKLLIESLEQRKLLTTWVDVAERDLYSSAIQSLNVGPFIPGQKVRVVAQYNAGPAPTEHNVGYAYFLNTKLHLREAGDAASATFTSDGKSFSIGSRREDWQDADDFIRVKVYKQKLANLRPIAPTIIEDGSVQYGYRIDGGVNVEFRDRTHVGLHYSADREGNRLLGKIDSQLIRTGEPGTKHQFKVARDKLTNPPREARFFVAIVDETNHAAESNESDSDNRISTKLVNFAATGLNFDSIDVMTLSAQIDGDPHTNIAAEAVLYFADADNGRLEEIRTTRVNTNLHGAVTIQVRAESFYAIPPNASRIVAVLDEGNRVAEYSESDNEISTQIPEHMLEATLDITQFRWGSNGVSIEYQIRQSTIPSGTKVEAQLFWSNTKRIGDSMEPAISKPINLTAREGKLKIGHAELAKNWEGERFLQVRLQPKRRLEAKFKNRKGVLDLPQNHGDLSNEIGRLINWKGPAKLRLSAWLHQHSETIKRAARNYRVPAEAIAGAISFEALRNISRTAKVVGKIDAYGFDAFAVEDTDKYRGRTLPSLNAIERYFALSSSKPDTAISYIAAIMNAYAVESRRAGLNLRMDSGALVSLFQNRLRNSKGADSGYARTDAIRTIESAIGHRLAGSDLGTGFLISPQHLLTASENVIDGSHGKFTFAGVEREYVKVQVLANRAISLVTLATPIGDIRPIDIATRKIIERLDKGDDVSWGIAHPEGDIGEISSVSGTNTISAHNAKELQWDWHRNKDELQGEAGNLGGPVLVKKRSGVQAVAVNAASESRLSGLIHRKTLLFSDEYIQASLQRIDAHGSLSTKIQHSRETWVIAHGRVDRGESFYDLAQSLARSTGDQVLVLDWSAGSSDNSVFGAGLDGARWIEAVGKWAAESLRKNFGISGDNLRLVGHSWGTFVAHEIAKSQQTDAKVLVAIDPAAEAFGGYNNTDVNFATKTQFSWAIYGDGLFGSAQRARTADAAFEIDYSPPMLNVSAFAEALEKHTAPIRLFQRLVESQTWQPITQFLSIDKIENGPSSLPWLNDQFGSGIIAPRFWFEGRFTIRDVDGDGAYAENWGEVQSFDYDDLTNTKRRLPGLSQVEPKSSIKSPTTVARKIPVNLLVRAIGAAVSRSGRIDLGNAEFYFQNQSHQNKQVRINLEVANWVTKNERFLWSALRKDTSSAAPGGSPRLGDLNNDLEIDAKDSGVLENSIRVWNTLSQQTQSENLASGDFDGDKRLTSEDSRLLAREIRFQSEEMDPIAIADEAFVPVGNSKTIDVLSNDQFPRGFATIEWMTSPSSGQVRIQGKGNGQRISYTPNPGFIGDDSFKYTVTDRAGFMTIGDVRVLVGDPKPKRDRVPEANIENSTLVVIGTEQPDEVKIERRGDQIRISFNGRHESFRVDSVGAIQFAGNAGDDYFSNRTSIPSKAYGGEGADHLVGGSSNDVLKGGRGPDILDGREGNDELHGGLGKDSLLGRRGWDVLHGDGGDDSLQGGNDGDAIYGGEGNDVADGGEGNDKIYGEGGDDTLIGNLGDDKIWGGVGHDVVKGGHGWDTLYGDAGNDLLEGEGDGDALYGGDGNDVADGGEGNDKIYGNAGDDELIGNLGDDKIWGGMGHDLLQGGQGYDTLYGDTGDDRLEGGSANDRLEGGDGKDHLLGGDGRDVLYGGRHNDHLEGGNDKDILNGEDGHDTLIGDGGDDKLYGGKGRDLLKGRDGHDRLYGGEDDDKLFGGKHNDYLDGGTGDDKIVGGENDDFLVGGVGHDQLFGELGNDRIYGGDGRDMLDGGGGHDQLFGENGRDTLYGRQGRDHLDGGKANDHLYGGGGADYLLGGSGLDLLDGGAGVDKLDRHYDWEYLFWMRNLPKKERFDESRFYR